MESHWRQAETLLPSVQADLPELPDPDPTVKSTPRVMVKLAAAVSGPLDATARGDLEAICRKVHVGRDVLDQYDLDWRRRPDATALAAPFWSLMIWVLLAFAEHHAEAEESAGDTRGLGLKCVNAALAALDLAEARGDGEHLPRLRGWASALVDRACCGATA